MYVTKAQVQKARKNGKINGARKDKYKGLRSKMAALNEVMLANGFGGSSPDQLYFLVTNNFRVVQDAHQVLDDWGRWSNKWEGSPRLTRF